MLNGPDDQRFPAQDRHERSAHAIRVRNIEREAWIVAGL
jgi:hypothetical protein